MAKKNNTMYWIIGAIAIIVFIYGGNVGWFNSFIINNPPSIANVTPSPTEPVLSSCSAVCTSQGFTHNYASSNCQPGESKVTYGYPNQPPLLVCCCYNEGIPPTPTCTDSDGGKIFNVGGKVTTPLGIMYDTCQPNGMDLLEFYCENGAQKSMGIGCVNGCVDAPSGSGDYCSDTHIWHPGDTVFLGNGAGVIGSATGFISTGEIDLADYGITVGGNCQLGAQFTTSWSYANEFCVGYMGMQGLEWQLHDSNGLEYARLDVVPIALGVDLHPTAHYLEWDGVTNWRGAAVMVPPGILQNCVLNYEYSVRIYIYSCS